MVVLVGNAVFRQPGTSVTDIGVHLVLLHGLFPYYQTAISGVLWTLSIEWLFYGLMLLLAMRFRRPGEGWLIAGAMLVVGVAWRTWISIAYRGHAGSLDFLDKQLIGAADVFACGMIVALLVHEGRGRKWWHDGRRAGVGLVVAVVGIVAGLVVFDAHAGTRFWSSQPMIIAWPLGFAIACGLCVLCIQRFEAPWRGVLGWTGLAYLGLISYGIYLLHPLVASAVYQAYGARHPRGPVWVLIPAILIVTVVLCVVTYRLIEQPALRSRRSLTTGTGPLAPRVSSDDEDWPDDEEWPDDHPPLALPSWAGLVAAVVGVALVTAIAVAGAGSPH